MDQNVGSSLQDKVDSFILFTLLFSEIEKHLLKTHFGHQFTRVERNIGELFHKQIAVEAVERKLVQGEDNERKQVLTDHLVHRFDFEEKNISDCSQTFRCLVFIEKLERLNLIFFSFSH